MSELVGNPFTPIFGKVPAYMAGRTELVEEMEQALNSEGNDPALVSLIVGPRGSGKTALLSLFANMAEGSGWVSARVTSAPNMLNDILVRINRSAGHLLNLDAGRKMSSVEVAHVGAVSWENVEGLSNWRSKMDDILDQLAETSTGLVVTVDEVDPDIEEMTTLVTTFQHFFDEGRKVALLMAGLPYGLTALLAGKTTSFLRRAVRHNLGVIPDYEVAEAMRITMEKGGKSMDATALDAAVGAISGFPYMFQLVGYRAWRFSASREYVTKDDVAAAVTVAQHELDERVYEATYFELTDADKAFLAAMLLDDDITPQVELAGRIGKSSGHVSQYKKRMLKQGIIQEKARGQLQFCLPGFKDFFQAKQSELG